MKLKLLLFHLFVMVGVLAYAQNDTIKTLLITERHGGAPGRSFIEITNMGDATLDLSMFELGATQENDYQGSGWRFPAGTMLGPGESYFIGMYQDFEWRRAKYMGMENYTEEPPTEFEQVQDFHVHTGPYDFANNPEGIPGDASAWASYDSVTTDGPPIGDYFMRNCIYLEQHFPSGDSAVIDQVGGTFGLDEDEDGVLENFYPVTDAESLPVAGYPNAGSFATLIRKYSVKQGNLTFVVGNSEDDSEWIALTNISGKVHRMQPWTYGNHGDYNLDANTLTPKAGSGITVDFQNKLITVPWGTLKPDGIMAEMEYTPGVAWEYIAAPTEADSMSIGCRTGDSLLVIVVGEDADRAKFRIEVEETASDNTLVPMMNQGSNYASRLEDGFSHIFENEATFGFGNLSWPWVTAMNESGVDTITGWDENMYNRGVPEALRLDTLLERLDKPADAAWEFVPVDGKADRPDIMEGDMIKVTAGDGSVKEYYIKVSVDVGNGNADLSTVTWPDIPDPELYEFLYGWQGDTIPNFSFANKLYQLKLPPEVENIPATVATPSDVNAKVEVQRATFLQGTQAERTTTYTVTATDDTTVQEYAIEWQPEPDPQYLQPYSAEPFFSQYIMRYFFDNFFLEIANTGNQPLDMSDYMIVSSWWANPAEAIVNAGNDDDWTHRFKKYIPGYKWPDAATWAIEENRWYAVPDPAVNPIVEGGDVFTLGEPNTNRWWGDDGVGWTQHDWPGETGGKYGETDVCFILGWSNPWGEEVAFHYSPIALYYTGNYQMLFKILNDSIKKGLKPANDPNDFDLIDIMGEEDGSNWMFGYPTVEEGHNFTKFVRKPQVTEGNPVLGASFGINDPTVTGEYDETSEWIRTTRATPGHYSGPPGWWSSWTVEPFIGWGSHYFIPYSGYLSTVSARIYKVSPGYSQNEQIRGLVDGVTVSGFYDGLTKKDEGQTLMVKSSADGSELAMDDLIVNGDTLVVVSADETNTTKYVLEVTENGLRSDALLTSARYTIEVQVEPTKSGSETQAAGEGTITGFEYGTQLRTVLANVTVPDGATMSIIAEDGNYVPLKRLNFDTVYVDVTVNTGTYFEVVAEDGVTTINYQLMPQASSDAAFITSDYFNVVQSDKLVEYVPGNISVSSLLAKLVPSAGATMMIVDKSGLERTMGSIARDDEIVVTSESGNVTNSYFIQVITSQAADGPGLGYYLAYITSNFYPIDQKMNVITVDNSAGDVSFSDFVSRLMAHTDGATLQIMDDNGNGMVDAEDMVKVTARDTRFSAMYSVNLTTSSRLVKNNISIYPNPTEDRVNISGLSVGSRIQVFNYTGASVRNIKVRSNIETLSLNDQPAGMYMILVSDADQVVGRYKVIKR